MPGGTIRILDVSSDFRADVVCATMKRTYLAHPIALPRMLYREKALVLAPTAEERTAADGVLACLRFLVERGRARRGAVDAMLGEVVDVFGEAFKRLTAEEDKPLTDKTDKAAPLTPLDYVLRFLALAHDYFCTQPSLAFYASQLCITEKYLGEIVSKIGGIQAKDYILSLRTAEAKRLLQNPLLTVTQVGQTLGFQQPTAFCTFFKRRTGMTPTEWRAARGIG